MWLHGNPRHFVAARRWLVGRCLRKIMRNSKTYCYWESPVGSLLLGGSRETLELISFAGDRYHAVAPEWRYDCSAFTGVVSQLRAYFAGELQQFSLKLAPKGTEFQLEVWEALREIPFGQTRSYKSIAERGGRPQAVRAVGAANGANPIPIVVPCHRVIGASGELVGFGGGLPIKRFLLELEGALPVKTRRDKQLSLAI